MIRFVEGDIFKADVDALVNTVNTEGIMGKGLALQFKKKYPDNFNAYAKACAEGRVTLGSMFTFDTNALTGPKYIINFPTKKHWRNKSSLQDIMAGLSSLAKDITRLGIKSIAVPPLGCGLGGLRWAEVKTAIENGLGDIHDVEIIVYSPLKGKNPAPVVETSTNMTPLKATILAAFQRYMLFATSTSVTFVEAHKLAYFLQVLGVPLRLNFAAWRYGPYARNLSHVFSAMEGRYIEGFRDGTALAFDGFTLMPTSANVAKSAKTGEYQNALKKLELLVEGFESPTSLELLATIHWLAVENSVPLTRHDMIEAISCWCGNREGWGDRKRRLFTDEDIADAIERIKTILSPQ